MSEVTSTFERAAELFEELSLLTPDERTAALGRVEDGEVREHLRRMLAGAERPCAGLDAPPAPPLPRELGGFRILRLLGEGGMGRVFEAEQRSPRRRVALKVLKVAFATPAMLRRFEQEAEVLGRLRHPGLATVYEAGTASVQGEQVPYLAMELVEGQPLDVHLERARPDLRTRVELVALLCDALEHAHQRGVVHRDLKPSNVLVEASGRPRILDFGIARILGREAEGTTQTQTGAVLGTVPYMSPEQMSGGREQVDLRSDVYALGVLLYEVLSGRRPFDLRDKGLAEAARIVTQEDPTQLGQLDPRLRGDLETIAAKALAKERERRYPSAAALGDDLRRTLRDEPIVARPVTTIYQLRKFARRNRRFVMALAFGILSLTAGLCASIVLAVLERGQRTLAEARALQLELQVYRQGIADVLRELRGGQRERAREILAELPDSASGWEREVLARTLDMPEVVADGHSREIYRILSDRTGTSVVTSSADGSVRAWDPVSGACTRVLDPGGQPRRMALSPDGRFLFTLAWDGSRLRACLWEDGVPVRVEELPAERMGWAECAFTHRGDLLLWGWNDGILRAWEVPGGAERYSVRVHDGDLRTLAVDSTDTLVATSGEEDERIRLVELETGRILRTLAAPGGTVAELLFLEQDTKLVGLGEAGEVRVWDVASGVPTVVDAGEPVACLDLDPARSRLLAGTRSGRILRIDVPTAQADVVLSVGYAVHRIEHLEDGRRLAVSAQDGRVCVLLEGSGQTLATFAPPGVTSQECTGLLALPGSDRIAAGAATGGLRFLSARATQFAVLEGHGSYLYGVEFDRAGTRILSGGWDQTLRLWDAARLEAQKVIPLPERVCELVSVGDGGRALVALMSGTVLAIDVPQGSVAWSWQGVGWGGDATALCASPDGSAAVVVAARTFVACRFDTSDGTIVASLPWRERTRAVTWDPRGAWIASGAPGRIAFHDPRTLEERRTLELEGTPQRLAVSPDSRWLVVGTREGAVHVLEVASGAQRASPDPHHGIVYALAFHPSGTRLACGSEDGSIALFETASWTRVADLAPHQTWAGEPTYRYVYDLAFSPDGSQLASASGDHTLRVWSTR